MRPCRLVSSEKGQDLIEYTLMLCFVVLATLLIIPWRHGSFVDKAVLLALLVAVGGGVTWSVTATLGGLMSRAQLVIVEIISDGRVCSRFEIYKAISKEHVLFKLFPRIMDNALASLAIQGKVIFKGGCYSIPVEARTGNVQGKSKAN